MSVEGDPVRTPQELVFEKLSESIASYQEEMWKLKKRIEELEEADHTRENDILDLERRLNESIQNKD
ncbi:hypothetical protein KAR91_03565 [Candidatus Pacearchaeota archaeon]|nr:hypothetical protein [Candidatus Pacearchaeota archaeon]